MEGHGRDRQTDRQTKGIERDKAEKVIGKPKSIPGNPGGTTLALGTSWLKHSALEKVALQKMSNIAPPSLHHRRLHAHTFN